MKQKPLLSVLLPLYNEPVVLAQQAVDSILNQSYQNLEIILLLDNPQNDALRGLLNNYLKQDPRIKIHVNETNLGLPETLNKGIDLSSGDYIARMDGDDISLPTRMESQLNFLLAHPKVDLVASNSYVINEEGKVIGEYHKLLTDFSQKIMLRYANINMIHPTWFGKGELFKKCHYRNFMHCEDYDFMARAYAMGANFYNLNDKLLYYRVQQTSCSSISRKYAYEQYQNTLKVRRQLNDFLSKKVTSYPDLPTLVYDLADKQKYQSTISLLNQLREAFFKNKLWSCLKLGIKIMQIDSRPLTSRFRVLILSRMLFAFEKLRLIR